MSLQRVLQLKLSWFAGRSIQNANLISRMLARLNQTQLQRHHPNRRPSLFWQAYHVYQYQFNSVLSCGAVVFLFD
jgi:hypothetical protein